MSKDRFTILYHKYLSGSLTELERDEWQALLADDELAPELEKFVDWFNVPQEQQIELSKGKADAMVDTIVQHPQSKGKRVSLWARVGIAAAVATIIISAGIWFLKNPANENPAQQSAHINDVAPGKQGATLTLANGQKILINDALAGDIASQSGVKISKTKDGQIIYEVTDQGTGTPEYNTLTTTRGEQTQVRLPDGSLVFLNAASSLRYPTSFAKAAKRIVGLMGEGYFEIAKNKAQPFVVTAAGQQVEVLGTHFNINAYKDEKAVRTTLLEGSVKVAPVSADGSVADNGNGKVLKPGQQSILTGKGIQVADVDTDEAMAWQKGYFSFYDEDITSIMRKVSRWYNIDVEYAGQLPENGFDARITKYSSIKEVLGKLEKTGDVHFKIEGRKVIVSK